MMRPPCSGKLEFDDALGACLAFQLRHPETLLDVTTDHGNANPGLNGTGPEYTQSDSAFSLPAKVKASYQFLARELDGRSECRGVDRGQDQPTNVDPSVVDRTMASLTCVRLSPNEIPAVCGALAAKGRSSPSDQQNNGSGVLGAIFGNHIGIGWTGTSHTADLAVVTAVGPSAANFEGLLDNTDIFGILTGVMRIPHRNPTMSPDDSCKYLVGARRSGRPHWA
jgi:alkaline phosphatase